MYAGRSTVTKATPTTTAATVCLLLHLTATTLCNYASAMSLDRLTVERNELSTVEAAKALEPPAAAIVVDNMKLQALPTASGSDMYTLVPHAVVRQMQATDEPVQQNIIETELAAEAQVAPVASTDMLMLESMPAMQLVELPSNMTVAVAHDELQAATQAVAEVPMFAAQPELIVKYVVKQKLPTAEEQRTTEGQQMLSISNEMTAEQQVSQDDDLLDYGTQLAEPVTEGAQPMLADEQAGQAVESLEPATGAAVTQESIADIGADSMSAVEKQIEQAVAEEQQEQQHQQAMVADNSEATVAQKVTELPAELAIDNEVVSTDATPLLSEMATVVENVLPEQQADQHQQEEQEAEQQEEQQTEQQQQIKQQQEKQPQQIEHQHQKTMELQPVEQQQIAADAAVEEPAVEEQAMAEPALGEPAMLEPVMAVPAESTHEVVPTVASDVMSAETEVSADYMPDIVADDKVQPAVAPALETVESAGSMLTTIIETATAAAAEPAVETAAAAFDTPTQAIESVLNYMNASFMQQPQDGLPNQEPGNLRRYDGAQVWRIVVQTDKDKSLADELQSKYDGQLWKEVKQEVDYLLKPQVLAAAERHIRAANLSRIVLIENLQHMIEAENPPAEKIAELQNRKGHRLTWQAYHRLEDIHGFVDYMAKTYPDICSTETIGYSMEKRPLKILKISNGNTNNGAIWIDGGMHAREWISPATVTYIANQLIEGWEEQPDYIRNITWYMHAVANPDGYEYSHTTDRLWRKNMRAHGRKCPGVDLNRNFGYKWGGKGTSASPCSQTYRGSKAFSEPETFYISKFISGFPRDTFKAYLSFHSYGQYILYPWGYDYHLTHDRTDLDRVARQAGTSITKSSGIKYTVGSAATTLYPAAGGSDDWAKGIAGIKYAFTIEMGDTGRYGFVLPASFIQYNGKDGYTFANTVARAISADNKQQHRRRF